MKLVKYYSPRCPACDQIEQPLSEIATEQNVAYEKIDATQNDVSHLNIRAVPTIIAYNDNNEVISQFTGYKSKSELNEWYNLYVNTMEITL